MPFAAELVGGPFTEFTGSLRDKWAYATSAGVRAATDGLKLNFRQDVAAAGLGNKLANAIGSKLYPAGGKDSLQAAGIVFPRGTLAEMIFDSFNEGPVIAPNGKKFLAIPTVVAGRTGRGGKRPTPADIKRQGIKLRFVKSKRPGYGLLVADVARGRKNVRVRMTVFFVLVPAVRMQRRLDFAARAAVWGDRVPELIERALPGE